MRLFLVFLLSWPQAQAAVLVQAPGVSGLDYRAALKADPDAVSPSQQLRKQRPSAANREALLAAFASAQESYLENSKEEAARRFQSVTALLTRDDWAANDRRIFLHAFLRLAQLQSETEKQNMWLARALEAGDDIRPEPGLFPPPLVRGLEKLRAEIPRVVPPEALFAEEWNTVLLNGVPCTKRDCAGLPVSAETARVTFLSDVWKGVTAALPAADLKTFKPAKSAWAHGDCLHSGVAEDLKDAKAFWGLDCEAKPLKLQPVARAESLPRLEIRESAPAFYKSKWFWGGVALAAAAAIIVNGQKHKEEREPTTTYGYQ